MLLLAVDHLEAVNYAALSNASGAVARLLTVGARVGHGGHQDFSAFVALHAGLGLLRNLAQLLFEPVAAVARHRAVKVVKQKVQVLFLLRRHGSGRRSMRDFNLDRALLRRFPLLVRSRVGVQLGGRLRLKLLLLQGARDVVRSYWFSKRIRVPDYYCLRQNMGQLRLVIRVP